MCHVILPTSLGEKGTPFESRLIILLSVCILAEFFQCFPQLCGKYQEPYEWLAVSPHCHPSHYVAGTVTLGANSRSLETRIGAVGLFISILAIFYIINWRGGDIALNNFICRAWIYCTYVIKTSNLWLTAPMGATPLNNTSATDWKIAVAYDGIMWLGLRSVKSINVDFLNQIRYFSIK